MLITILATIVVLGVLIFVHELGHFVTAKMVDIEVPRFSIGLGPKLIGFRRGETEYVISWLPLGGYVKMAGMEEMEKLEGGPTAKPTVTGTGTAMDLGVEVETPREAGPRDFESKSLPARALVISAGVIMNILFAVILLSISGMIWGVESIADSRVGDVTEEYLPEGTEALAAIPRGARVISIGGETVNDFRDLRGAIAKAGRAPVEFSFDVGQPITVRIPQNDSAKAALMNAFSPAVDIEPVLGAVDPGRPAARAQLKAGDRVTRVNDVAIKTWQDFAAQIESQPGRPLRIEVERAGRVITTTVTPETRDLRGVSQYGRLGVSARRSAASAVPRERLGLISGIAYGFEETWNVVVMTVDFLRDLFTGNASARSVGGPIQIGQLSGRVVRMGAEAFLGFMAFFSINLAVLNLLPIPVLDGGHLMFLAVEGIRGRALSIEQRMRASQVGFVIVLMIMVWAVANDVLKLFGL
jgi:regulator of sigma E protease